MKLSMAVMLLFMTGCEISFVDKKASSNTLKKDPKPIVNGDWYKVAPYTSWHLQLIGDINTAYDASVYIVDLFDTREEFIDKLKSNNIKVMCYFSAGLFNPYIQDKDSFSEFVLGKNIENTSMKWLDIRSDNVFDVMNNRLDLAVKKGCDGVVPDDFDEYQHDNGFDITDKEQILYAKHIANSAHSKTLSVGLFGVADLSQMLEPHFDFIVGIDCHKDSDCHKMSSFKDAKKGQFNVEFGEEYVRDEVLRDEACGVTKNLDIYTIVLPVKLNGEFRYYCE